LVSFTLGGAFLGGAAIYDGGGNTTVGLAVGAVFGLLLGLVFAGARGKWLESIFDSGLDGEADETAPGPL
jgi:hypothetical protein